MPISNKTSLLFTSLLLFYGALLLTTPNITLAAWEVDLTPPNCQPLEPPTNSSFTQGTSVTIKGTATIASEISSLKLFRSGLGSPVSTSSISPLSYPWNTTGLLNNYTFTLQATDKAGNINLNCAQASYTITTTPTPTSTPTPASTPTPTSTPTPASTPTPTPGEPWMRTSGGDVHVNQ